MVDVRLSPVRLDEKAALRADLDAYLIVHADLVDPARRHGEPTHQPYYDAYWSEEGRRPFWILANGARAGFVLINRHAPSGLACDAAVAEFCVLPAFRRMGLGRAAAHRAFALAVGQWELQVHRANPVGMAFWARAIATAPVAGATEIPLEDRVIHRFRTA
ncbi:MAG: GNAT family N-acetyltransferase [Caulobacteraceae bacterium]|nr:GNAT family N-acetyltransferase [Caulobacteraceae bacterium]